MDLARFDKIIDKIAQELHSGKLKPEQLNQELISQTYSELEKGAKKGYGKNWNKFPADGKGTLPIELKKNIYAFSGAKTYAQLEELNRYLFDNDGKLRPFNEYKVLAKKLNRQYNENYLQAEWQTARTAAQMAEKWERIQDTKELFPNLKYRTVGDDRVRREHERLNGIIRPIDDPFWSKFYPPLDWRCRCDVVATAEAVTKEIKETDLPKPQFQGNVGIDQEIFTRKGTFFKLAKTNSNAVRNIELSKLNAPYEVAYKSKSDKKVEVNIFKDVNDFDKNLNAGIVLVDQIKENVMIRPHINVSGHSNPEFLINGKLSDLKWNFKDEHYKGIENAFTAAKRQGLESIVFDFTYKFKDLDIRKVVESVTNKVNKNNGNRYHGLYFIYKEKAVYVSREDILSGDLYKALKTLKPNS